MALADVLVNARAVISCRGGNPIEASAYLTSGLGGSASHMLRDRDAPSKVRNLLVIAGKPLPVTKIDSPSLTRTF